MYYFCYGINVKYVFVISFQFPSNNSREFLKKKMIFILKKSNAFHEMVYEICLKMVFTSAVCIGSITAHSSYTRNHCNEQSNNLPRNICFMWFFFVNNWNSCWNVIISNDSLKWVNFLSVWVISFRHMKHPHEYDDNLAVVGEWWTITCDMLPFNFH